MRRPSVHVSADSLGGGGGAGAGGAHNPFLGADGVRMFAYTEAAAPAGDSSAKAAGDKFILPVRRGSHGGDASSSSLALPDLSGAGAGASYPSAPSVEKRPSHRPAAQSASGEDGDVQEISQEEEEDNEDYYYFDGSSDEEDSNFVNVKYLQHTKQQLDIKLAGPSSEILSDHALREILRHAPKQYLIEPWRRVYSITKNGSSMDRFEEKVADSWCSLLVFKDSTQKIFGGLNPRPWKQGTIGSGEAFVFDIPSSASTATTTDALSPDAVRVFKWSGTTSFFVRMGKDGLSFGGGGSTALFIDNYFSHGTSGESQTYRNPVLAGAPKWRCYAFEVWVPGAREDSHEEDEE